MRASTLATLLALGGHALAQEVPTQPAKDAAGAAAAGGGDPAVQVPIPAPIPGADPSAHVTATATRAAPEASADAISGRFTPLLCYANAAIHDHIYTVNADELGKEGRGDWKPCATVALVNVEAKPGYSKLFRYLDLTTLDHVYHAEAQIETKTVRPEGFEGFVSQKKLKGMVTLDVLQHPGTKDHVLALAGAAAPKGYAKVKSLGWVLPPGAKVPGTDAAGAPTETRAAGGAQQPQFWAANPTDKRLQPVFRYWNPALRDHFYTMDYELLGTGKNGWRYQGIQMYIFPTKVAGTVPMYRYWNLRLGDHFYTTDFYDMGEGKDGYRFKGILGYVRSAPSDATVALYRYFNKDIGDHFYTTNTMSTARGHEAWSNEGIAAYVYPVPSQAKKGEASAYSLMVPMYRYWNKRYQDHFYTTIWKEVSVGTHGWQYQGVQALVYPKQQPGTVPLYRYWNIRTLDHFYTTNFGALGDAKKDTNGWKYEGIECYVNTDKQSGTTALYRYFNQVANDHFYTTKWLGRDHKGYVYEGVQAYVHAAPGSAGPDGGVGPLPAGLSALFQYYSAATHAHRYTTRYEDLGTGASEGYVLEGVVGLVHEAAIADTEPLHRYFNARVGDTYLTTDYTVLKGGKDGWAYEGVIGNVKTRQAPGDLPVSKFFNKAVNDHVYTTATSGAAGYESQGVAFYVTPYTGKLSLTPGANGGPATRSGSRATALMKTLYQYYNPSTRDTYVTTSFSVLGGSQGAHGWTYVGAIGKCAAADDGSGSMLRLRQYFSKARKDHRYTIRHIRGGDWTLEGTVCYLSPVAGEGKVKLMDFENATTMDNAITTLEDGPKNGQSGYRYIETLGFVDSV